MNSKKIQFLIIGIVFLFSIGLNFWILNNQEQIAYVDLQKVFNDFKGKQEIEAKFMSFNNNRKQVLDSIAMDIRILQGRLNQSPKADEIKVVLSQKENLFTQLSNDFAIESQKEDQTSTDKIWTQINQYTKDFGKQNGYDFIYGVSGNGALMYGKTEKDITSNLIKYINNRYEGL